MHGPFAQWPKPTVRDAPLRHGISWIEAMAEEANRIVAAAAIGFINVNIVMVCWLRV